MRSIILPFVLLQVLLSSCGSDTVVAPQPSINTYLNHGDSATYLGMEQCRSCHQDKFESFMHTGMGMSFDKATKGKSAGDFSKSQLFDKHTDYHYQMFFKGEEMWMNEFRMKNKDTVFSREQLIQYIIGSGQHTNSHIYSNNGYLHQAPMTYYTQKGQWDLPPGFENGHNTRFERKIGLECMTCHNAFPEMVIGSENKYTNIQNGIDCERCHGPGSLHVKRKLAGEKVDTSRYIDYSIVNPGKLRVDLQFDVCQRCHLQGNAVLKDGKSFFDFKPGMSLSDFWTVFLPKYEGAEKEFIMASHADRLKMSKCFLETTAKVKHSDALRPYKDAMTCVTCHNPHISVKTTSKDVFNNACGKCHGGEKGCTEKPDIRKKKEDNCVSCHMPRSGAIDIPHVTVTDHYIQRSTKMTVDEKSKVKKFIGLHAINAEYSNAEERARAYLYQYEKFEQAPYYLDSAKMFLDKDVNKYDGMKTWVHYYFIKNDFQSIVQLITQLDKQTVLNVLLTKKSWDNGDAWAAYRIGEAFSNTGDNIWAEWFYKKACELAAFNLEFRNKLAATYVAQGKLEEAKAELEFILKENLLFAPGWSNLGFYHLIKKDDKTAEKCFLEALKLDPDYESAMNNMLRLYVFRQDKVQTAIWLKKNEMKFPNSTFVKEMKKLSTSSK